MGYCSEKGPNGFYCVRKAGHEGDHLSIDNSQIWKGSPGAPVFWPQEALRREVTGEVPKAAFDPTLTQEEAGLKRKTKSLYLDQERALPGYGHAPPCEECGSLNTRPNGLCTVCDDCGHSGACG